VGWQKNSKTKVEKAFFFIFMSFYLYGKELLGPKSNIVFFKKANMGFKEISNLTLISKWAYLPF
jgi:hypothetical protein